MPPFRSYYTSYWPTSFSRPTRRCSRTLPNRMTWNIEPHKNESFQDYYQFLFLTASIHRTGVNLSHLILESFAIGASITCVSSCLCVWSLPPPVSRVPFSSPLCLCLTFQFSSSRILPLTLLPPSPPLFIIGKQYPDALEGDTCACVCVGVGQSTTTFVWRGADNSYYLYRYYDRVCMCECVWK